jgi:hypothetical protein
MVSIIESGPATSETEPTNEWGKTLSESIRKILKVGRGNNEEEEIYREYMLKGRGRGH